MAKKNNSPYLRLLFKAWSEKLIYPSSQNPRMAKPRSNDEVEEEWKEYIRNRKKKGG
jgi:hypothetical protein